MGRQLVVHRLHRWQRFLTNRGPKRLDELQELGLALLRVLPGDMVAQELQPCEAERLEDLSGRGVDEGADMLRIRRIGEDGGEVLIIIVVLLVVPVKRGVRRLLVEPG